MTIGEVVERLNKESVRHVVSLSGGKDSTALALYMKETYPQIPVEYIFCDTGAELPETYEYLKKLEELLGKPVKRLSALDLLKIEKKVDRKPFDIFLNEVYGGFLPNPRARWCTRVLKIQPFEQYIGEDHAYSYIGIRWDENREGYQPKKPPVLSERPNIVPVYPFKDDELALEDITAMLEDSGLGLPDYYRWRSRSGCYFCFYQQIGEWQGLKENHPDLFQKAKEYEKTENGKQYTWTDRRSLVELETLDRRYGVRSPNDVDGCAICHL